MRAGGDRPDEARDRDLIAEALVRAEYRNSPAQTLATIAIAEEVRQARLDTKKHRAEVRAESRRQHQELIRVLSRIR